MSDLSFCLQAAALHDEDSSSLSDAIERYVGAGMPMRRAQMAAIADVLADLHAEREQIHAAVREQHTAPAQAAVLAANPFRTFLMRQGVALQLAADFAPGTRERLSMGRTFRRDGLELDQLAQRAAEQGFLRDPHDIEGMHQLIARAAAGERIAPLFGADGEAELAARMEQHRQLEEESGRTLGLSPQELEETGFTQADPEVQARVRLILAKAEVAGVDPESILADAAHSAENGTDHDFLRAAESALDAAISRAGDAGAHNRSQGAGEAGAEAARADQGQAGAAGPNGADVSPAFRRGDELAAVERRTFEVQEQVSKLTRDWLRKPDIHVVGTIDDLPEPLRRPFEQQSSNGARGGLEGVHWRGGVYLLAEALHTPEDVQRVLFHESLGHFGLRGVFGANLDRVLTEVAAAMPQDLARKARQYGFDLQDPRQKRMAAEELLAELAESRPELGVVQRAVAAIRTWLRAHGIDSLKMTREEIIRNFILPARDFVERGRQPFPGYAARPNQEVQLSRAGTTPATEGMPSTAPDSRWERSKTVLSDLIDEGLSRSGVYRFTSPMSEGSVRARAIAQNFANAERGARMEWQRIADLLQKRFTPEQRQRMWEAADEQNTLLQHGQPTAGAGLERLTPGERDVVEQLHTYGEELLRRAKIAGMFEGEGLPYWTPRMMVMIDANGEYARPTEPGKKQTSDGDGRNVFTSSQNLKQRKYVTAAETEAAMQAKGGELVRDIMTMPLAMQRLERAIAGRELINQVKDLGRATGTPTVSTGRPDHEGWFTLDHAAFTTFQPRFERDADTGKMRPLLDEKGDMVFDRVPLYMSKEFEGPIRAILSNNEGPLYRAYMLLKSKAMSAIMFSPLIHNLVIFGRALGYDPTMAGTVALYFRGHAARQDNEMLRTAIAGGMVPMGYHRNGMVDVTDVARGFGREGGWLDPQESWIAHGARAILGAVHRPTGDFAKRFIDKAGDVWHGTLLWNRVADLQMGIFAHAYERLQAKGFEPGVARVLAAHWANRYAGAIARENMSEYARKAANVLLFSRSFNMGNLGTVKDLAYGLPSGLRAKIEAEYGRAAASKAFTEARRKAWSGFVADAAMSLIALSVAQSAVDRLKKDKGWDEIFGGYVDRAHRMWETMKAHPANPASYSPWQLSPTHDNEPGKQDRVDMGALPDAGGRHEYMRLPTGKVVEDLFNWTTHFPTTFESKMSPLAKSAWQALTNDRGFGVPVYDPSGNVSQDALDVAKHLARAQTPWDTIVTAWDRLHGKSSAIEGDKLVGNVTGFSYSQGHPQGPEAGVATQVEDRIKAQKMLAMEEVKRLLKYDHEDQARQKLEDIGLSPREITQILQRIDSPKDGMTRGQQKKFNQHGTEEDQQRMDHVTR